MRLAVLVVAAAVMLAGCSTGVLEPGTTTDTTAATTTTTTTTTAAPTTTTTATTTHSPTTTPPPDNQWRKNPVTVAVENDANPDRNVTALVEDAIAYWNNNSERYAGVNVTFALQERTSAADVRIAFTERIPRCGEGDTDDPLGCAETVPPGTTPPETVNVQVRAGFDDRTTRETIKHELGHVLGLGHDDAPQPLMNATAGYSATLPRPNATEVPLPWESRNLTVHVDTSDVAAGHDRQVQHALDYFEDGADDTLEVTPRFRRVASPREADIVIRLHGSERATDRLDDPGSVGHVYGVDPDEDGALERYTNATIVVAGIDNDASGWHVAYWLAYALGYTEAELPPPLTDADYDDRRSEWWT